MKAEQGTEPRVNVQPSYSAKGEVLRVCEESPTSHSNHENPREVFPGDKNVIRPLGRMSLEKKIERAIQLGCKTLLIHGQGGDGKTLESTYFPTMKLRKTIVSIKLPVSLRAAQVFYYMVRSYGELGYQNIVLVIDEADKMDKREDLSVLGWINNALDEYLDDSSGKFRLCLINTNRPWTINEYFSEFMRRILKFGGLIEAKPYDNTELLEIIQGILSNQKNDINQKEMKELSQMLEGHNYDSIQNLVAISKLPSGKVDFKRMRKNIENKIITPPHNEIARACYNESLIRMGIRHDM